MSTLIRFTPELGQWIVGHLDGGSESNVLIDTMIAQQMEPQAARVIVSAFIDARRLGRPMPQDAVLAEDAADVYVYDAPRLKSGSRIATFDREVGVSMRAERPMVVVLTELLTADECEQLIALARPRLQPSTVVDPLSGRDVQAAQRSSFGMFFRLLENPFIATLDRRISEVMNLPVENGEGIQLLHYPVQAANAAHFDFLASSNAANRESIARSGQRTSTLITYLNDVPLGGETVFPRLGWAVAPRRGNAVYFEYCNQHGQVDHATLHAGNPVLQGEKWIATKWMRQRRFISADGKGSEGMVG